MFFFLILFPVYSCGFILASQLNSDLLKSDRDVSNDIWRPALSEVSWNTAERS